MKVQTILDQIDLGHVALPEFQRGYVWGRHQVRALMQSMYRRYPVGSLLVWVTQTESANARGDGELSHETVKLLLDGQQRSDRWETNDIRFRRDLLLHSAT